MIKIAYCDDVEKDREGIMKSLNQIEEKNRLAFELYEFESGESLCESLKNVSYDIILLDILMDGIDGIDTARKIRSFGEDSKIIFISSYDKKLRELFTVGTTAFLDKPLDKTELESALLRACNEINNAGNKLFTYRSNKNEYHIPLKDILCIESKNHHIVIYTIKDTIKYYGNLKTAWASLMSNVSFGMPQKSYIVNFKFSQVTKTCVNIKGRNITITIGRVFKDEFIDKYTLYMQKRSIS